MIHLTWTIKKWLNKDYLRWLWWKWKRNRVYEQWQRDHLPHWIAAVSQEQVFRTGYIASPYTEMVVIPTQTYQEMVEDLQQEIWRMKNGYNPWEDNNEHFHSGS